MRRHLADAAATEALGAALAAVLPWGSVVFLEGELGAGKTTLMRGFLGGLGHRGPVKSPTYTLVEAYPFEAGTVYHFDLYRLSDPEELEYIGIRDFFGEQSICVVEWPERGAGVLPAADLSLRLSYAAEGRDASLAAGVGGSGAAVLQALSRPGGGRGVGDTSGEV